MRRIWDTASGKCLRVLEGHSGRVNAVAVCDQRSTVLTASDDSTARVWDMETGRCLAVLEVSNQFHLSTISRTSSCARTQPYHLWLDLSRRLLSPPPNAVACMADLLMQGHGGWLTGVTVSHDGAVAVTTSGDELGLVWELPSGNRRQSLTGHSGEVSASILTRKARCAFCIFMLLWTTHRCAATPHHCAYPRRARCKVATLRGAQWFKSCNHSTNEGWSKLSLASTGHIRAGLR